MYQEQFIEIFEAHRALVVAEVEGILRQQLPDFTEQKIKRLLKGTLKILKLYPALSQVAIDRKTQKALQEIVKNEYIDGMSLEKVLQIKLLIRDWGFQMILKQLLAQKVGVEDLVQFMHWRNQVSQNLSLHVIAFYEKTYQEKIHRLDDNYKGLLDRIYDLVLVVGADGRLEYFNQKTSGFLGYVPKQLSKLQVSDLIHPGDLDAFQKLFKDCPKEGVSLDLRILNHDSQTKIVNFFIARNKKRWSKVVLECVGHDLSGDLLLESKLEERYRKMQEAYIELGKVNRQVIFLADLCSLFSRFDDYTERINYVLYVIAQLLQADTILFRELDQAKKCLTFRHAYKFEEEWAEIMFTKDQTHVSWQAILQRRRIYVPDISRDQEHNYYGLTKRFNFNSVLAFPVIFAGKSLGVINAFASKTDAFNEYPVEILEAVVNQFALLWHLQNQLQANSRSK